MKSISKPLLSTRSKPKSGIKAVFKPLICLLSLAMVLKLSQLTETGYNFVATNFNLLFQSSEAPIPSKPQLLYQNNEIMALIHFNMGTFVGDSDPTCNEGVKQEYQH